MLLSYDDMPHIEFFHYPYPKEDGKLEHLPWKKFDIAATDGKVG
jgi:hypothetical protein